VLIILPWRTVLDRNTKVRDEVVERMDAAGVDFIQFVVLLPPPEDSAEAYEHQERAEQRGDS
jgi:hypothetical protein